MWCRPSEEECRKEWFKLFMQFSSSRSLSSFRPIICSLFPHLTSPGALPDMPVKFFAKKDCSTEGSWEVDTNNHRVGGSSPPF